MPDRTDIRIGKATDRSLVSLRVSRAASGEAAKRLDLAPPLCSAGEEPQSLWLGPDHWLLVGRQLPAAALIERCRSGLAGLLHNAVDQSAAHTVWRIEGPAAGEVLASGAALDFRQRHFPLHGCRPTRLAQVPAVVVAVAADAFELYVDRGYGQYLRDWLEDSLAIATRAARRGLAPTSASM